MVEWRLLVEEHIANIGIPLDVIKFLLFLSFSVFLFFYFYFWLFETSLLCIMEKLAGGRSAAVALGVSYR